MHAPIGTSASAIAPRAASTAIFIHFSSDSACESRNPCITNTIVLNLLLGYRNPFSSNPSSGCMKDDVRTATVAADDDTHITNVPHSLSAIAEEVRTRGQKSRTTTLQIPQNLAPAWLNAEQVRCY